MSRHNTTRNGVYGLAARYALAILAWIVASAGVSAQPFQQFEDDNTQMKFEGVDVHVCKGNSLLIGVDVEKNRFLCQTVNEPLGQLFVDKDTHAPGLNTHTCPTFASMVGLSVDKNWLICAQLPPTGWVAGDSLFGSLTVDGPPGATQAPEPNDPSRNMHVCTNDIIQSLAGIKVDENKFICMENLVTSCMEFPSTPGCQ
jgi:hypothetical protein